LSDDVVNILRAVVFTFLIPGTIAVLIPHSLSSQGTPADFGKWRFTGIPVTLAGIIVYVACVIRFLFEGGGTPAIWFTRPFRFLIGEEPSIIVCSGLYRFSRNPMYVGVLAMVAGQGEFFQSSAVLAYAAFLWLCFHIVVVLIEEPHLKEKHGKQYEEYLRTTPRWIRWRR
jgi:protein-S-isoprenylcysteine O-methyltransferase Ste14